MATEGGPRLVVDSDDPDIAQLLSRLTITIKVKPARCQGLTKQSQYTERCKITWNLDKAGFCKAHVSQGQCQGKGK